MIGTRLWWAMAKVRRFVTGHLYGTGPAWLPALFRVLYVALLWSRFGRELRPYRLRDDPWWLAISLAFWLSTILVGLGILTRWSTVLLALTVAAMGFGMGVLVGFYDWRHHHTWLLFYIGLLLPLTASGYALSVDAWWTARRGRSPRVEVPYWGLRMLALIATSCYLFGAWDKLQWTFLRGDRVAHHLMSTTLGGGWPLDQAWGWRILFALLGSGIVALEFSLAIGLWHRRLRPVLIPLGVLFHLGLYLTLPVGTFSATICVLYLCFLDEQDLRWLWPGGAVRDDSLPVRSRSES